MSGAWSGTERRMSSDQQIGYIKGKVEGIEGKVSDYIEQDLATKAALSSEVAHLRGEVASIKKELNVYRFMWMTVKTIAAAVLLALTIRLGDIINLFK